MIYLKSVLVGIAAAVAASVIWLLAVFLLPLLPALLASWNAGSGGIGAVSGSLWPWPFPILPAAAFAAGFYWEYQRVSRRTIHADAKNRD